MRVSIKLYATLTDYLPPGTRNNRVEVDLADSTTIDAALAPFALPAKMTHLVLVNGVYIPQEGRVGTCLQDGDTLAVWPPIAGG